MGKEERRVLREQYDNRHPGMGVICWKCKDRMWIGLSKDIRASYNSTRFQLELNSWPKKELQYAFNEDPDGAEWLVLKEHEYEDPSADYAEDLELLLLEAMDEYPGAKPMSSRKYC